MNFVWEVNIGNVLTAVLLLIGFYAAHRQNIERIQSIETKVEMIYHWFLTKVVNK